MKFLKTCVVLICKTLVIAMLAQGIFSLFVPGAPFLFYASLSGLFLGFVPYSSIVSELRPSGILRGLLTLLLIGIVAANCLLAAWWNKSDLGRINDTYPLEMPLVWFFLALSTPFLCHPSRIMGLFKSHGS